MDKMRPHFIKSLSGKSLIRLPKIIGYVIRLHISSNYKVNSSKDFDGDGFSFLRRIDNRNKCPIRTTSSKGIRFYKKFKSAIKSLAQITEKYPYIYGEVVTVRGLTNN